MSSITSIDELSNEKVRGNTIHEWLNPSFKFPGPMAQMSVHNAAATCFGGGERIKTTFGVGFAWVNGFMCGV